MLHPRGIYGPSILATRSKHPTHVPLCSVCRYIACVSVNVMDCYMDISTGITMSPYMDTLMDVSDVSIDGPWIDTYMLRLWVYSRSFMNMFAAMSFRNAVLTQSTIPKPCPGTWHPAGALHGSGGMPSVRNNAIRKPMFSQKITWQLSRSENFFVFEKRDTRNLVFS